MDTLSRFSVKLSCTSFPYCKGVYYKWKDFAPKGTMVLEQTPFRREANSFERGMSPQNVSILLNP